MLIPVCLSALVSRLPRRVFTDERWYRLDSTSVCWEEDVSSPSLNTFPASVCIFSTENPKNWNCGGNLECYLTCSQSWYYSILKVKVRKVYTVIGAIGALHPQLQGPFAFLLPTLAPVERTLKGSTGARRGISCVVGKRLPLWSRQSGPPVYTGSSLWWVWASSQSPRGIDSGDTDGLLFIVPIPRARALIPDSLLQTWGHSFQPSNNIASVHAYVQWGNRAVRS